MATLRLDGGYEPVIFRLYSRKRGADFRDETLIAFDRKTDRVLAVGSDARKYINDPSEETVVACPLRNGAPAEFDTLATMLRCFLVNSGAAGKNLFRRPSVAVCVPYEITQIERTALGDAFRQAGGGNVRFFEDAFEEGVEKYGEKFLVVAGFELQAK